MHAYNLNSQYIHLVIYYFNLFINTFAFRSFSQPYVVIYKIVYNKIKSFDLDYYICINRADALVFNFQYIKESIPICSILINLKFLLNLFNLITAHIMLMIYVCGLPLFCCSAFFWIVSLKIWFFSDTSTDNYTLKFNK